MNEMLADIRSVIAPAV